MSIILLARGYPGTLEAYLPLRPDASPTIEIRNRQGGIVLAATAVGVTRDPVATTLAQGYGPQVESLVLTSGADVAAGKQYRISGGGSKAEFVEVEQVDGSGANATVYLAGKTAYPHPAGCAFEDTRVSYSYTPGSGQYPEHAWRAWFGFNVGAVAQVPVVVEFAITMHPVVLAPALPSRLYGILPQLDLMLHKDTDVVQKIERAQEEILEDMLAEGLDPSWIVGRNKFDRAVDYLALFLCAEQYGAAFKEVREEARERYRGIYDQMKINMAVDSDKDNAVESHEAWVDVGFVDRG